MKVWYQLSKKVPEAMIFNQFPIGFYVKLSVTEGAIFLGKWVIGCYSERDLNNDHSTKVWLK